MAPDLFVSQYEDPTIGQPFLVIRIQSLYQKDQQQARRWTIWGHLHQEDLMLQGGRAGLNG